MGSTGPEIAPALAELDGIVRRLREQCPWDREQDERSIVPHTVEEAYELADAAQRRDDARILDELGDVLFQVHFLALLLEERGAGDLGAVARHAARKLIRRHPHVFGQVRAETPAQVLANWDQIKASEPGRERGLFGELPENLPATLYARKVQRRAAAGGFDLPDGSAAVALVREALDELELAGEREQLVCDLGDLMFAVVALARKLGVDPELSLRLAAQRFRERVQAAGEDAAAPGPHLERWRPDRRLRHYRLARRPADDEQGAPQAK